MDFIDPASFGIGALVGCILTMILGGMAVTAAGKGHGDDG